MNTLTYLEYVEISNYQRPVSFQDGCPAFFFVCLGLTHPTPGIEPEWWSD